MPRNADDILIGGGRVSIDGEDVGWLSGEIKVEEQANTYTVKESEGGTVLVINLDKEVHFSFNLLEANLSVLRKINPSMGKVLQGDQTYSVTFTHKKRSGGTRTLTIPKAKIAGSFTSLLINQDNESPIPVDIIALADETQGNDAYFYTISDSGGTGGNG